MNKTQKMWIQNITAATVILASSQAMAQQWPQSENAYTPSAHSPQWIEKDMPRHAAPSRPMGAAPANAPAYPAQPPMQYAPQYGYAPQFYGNAPYGYAPPMNNGYPYAPNGAYGYPNYYGYGPRNGWSNFPSSPFWGNNSGWWPGSNFSPSNMSMPNFDMPSPSFNFPTMNMPFWN